MLLSSLKNELCTTHSYYSAPIEFVVFLELAYGDNI